MGDGSLRTCHDNHRKFVPRPIEGWQAQLADHPFAYTLEDNLIESGLEGGSSAILGEDSPVRKAGVTVPGRAIGREGKETSEIAPIATINPPASRYVTSKPRAPLKG